MIIVLFFSGGSIGKAINNTQINVKGEVAEPIVVVENNPKINLTATEKEGTYKFFVKNYNDSEKITQVDMKYSIEILSKLDDAISVKILKNNTEIQMNNNKSEEFLLSKDNKQKDEYKVEIKYDKEKSTSIEEIIQDLQIKVHSEQVQS